jgi:hypothetical protein
MSQWNVTMEYHNGISQQVWDITPGVTGITKFASTPMTKNAVR